MARILEGNAWVLGDHVNTDVIIPSRYLNTLEPDELAPHCFAGVDSALASRIEAGDIVVAGHNFGCGSSREHAPIAIKALGVSCIIARSYGQIFYRNAFNRGLPLLELDCPGGSIRTGDRLNLNLDDGRIENLSTGKIFEAMPIPAFMQEILASGGLIPYVLQRDAKNSLIRF